MVTKITHRIMARKVLRQTEVWQYYRVPHTTNRGYELQDGRLVYQTDKELPEVEQVEITEVTDQMVLDLIDQAVRDREDR